MDQWCHALRGQNVSEAFDVKHLLKCLLSLRHTTEKILCNRITALDQTLATKEFELNALIYQLYHLTPVGIVMVETGQTVAANCIRTFKIRGIRSQPL